MTAPGDELCHTMLTFMGEIALGRLLRLYNRVWEEGQLPKSWKEAVVVLIRKPGKDPVKPTSYRPIALTSHIGKIMEHMVTDRLVYFLEKGEVIDSYQSGFRKGRGTMDPVLCLEDEIRKPHLIGNQWWQFSLTLRKHMI